MVDIKIEDRGADALVRALTREGRNWLQKHVTDGHDSAQGFVAGNSSIPDIVASAQGDGVVVRVKYGCVSGCDQAVL